MQIIELFICLLKFGPKNPFDNKPGLVQTMAYSLLGDKTLSETIMALFAVTYMRHSASMN